MYICWRRKNLTFYLVPTPEYSCKNRFLSNLLTSCKKILCPNYVHECYWEIDPRGRPQSWMVVITIFSVCPSVPKLENQAKITAGRDCGLAEWIVDDSCLVLDTSSETKALKFWITFCITWAKESWSGKEKKIWFSTFLNKIYYCHFSPFFLWKNVIDIKKN